MKRSLTILCLSVLAMSLAAQDLHKEINVERTVVPNERSASPLSTVTPSLVLPAVTVESLIPAEYTLPGSLRTELAPLPPQPWADSIAPTPYRGYASLTYGPTFNLGASAGYAIVDRRATKASIWMQYDGISYRDIPAFAEDKLTFSRNFITVGGRASHSFAPGRALSANLSYTYAAVGHPVGDFSQGVNDLRLRLGWNHAMKSWSYDIATRVEYFGFTKSSPQAPAYAPTHQTLFDVMLGAGAVRSGKRWLGIDASAKYLLTNNSLNPADPAAGFSDHTLWKYDLRPFALLSVGDFSARLGLRLDIAHVYATKMRLSPDVTLSYAGGSAFAASVHFGGGMQIATTSTLFSQDPYLQSFNQYGTSTLPFAVDGSLTVGPVAGFSLTLFGGYTSAERWMMPTASAAFEGDESEYIACNIKGWTAGARARYAFRSLFAVSASAQHANSSDTDPQRGWYLWRDRAAWDFSAVVDIFPVDRLAVTFAYSARTSRRAFPPSAASDLYAPAPVDLGNISDLSLSASYRLTPALTLSLNAENILAHHNLLISGIPAPSSRFLLSAAYKF